MEKAKRYFERTANTSVAADTKETIFSKSFKGVLRQLFIRMDGNDSTGKDTCEIKITVDGKVLLNHSIVNLYCNFCYGGFDAVSYTHLTLPTKRIV